MRSFVKYFIRDFLRFTLGKKKYTYLRFVITHKYLPSLNHPRSFSEKIIFRKFNDNPEMYSKYVDKYLVRDYVKYKVGDEYLIPLLMAKDSIALDDFDELPSEFVIKTSNGGGGENVKIIKDKNSVDLKTLSKNFNDFLKLKIGDIVDERFYDIETPKIIIEKLMKHKDGSLPVDYKIHVFNRKNKPEIIIQVDEDRFGNHKRSLFGLNKNKLDFDIQPKYDSVNKGYKWPQNFDEMIEVAKKLSEDFKYTRVDLYNIDGCIYFGELTFCHGSGWEPLSSKDADFLLGSYWEEYE